MLSVGEVVAVFVGGAMLFALLKFADVEEKKKQTTERKRIEDQMSQKMEGFKSPPDWQERRNYVLDRDHHQCQKCGSTDSLHVHHIIPRKVSMSHSVGNLVTLCHECHGKEHNITFYSNSEREIRLYLKARVQYGRRIKSRKLHECDYCRAQIKSGSYYICVDLEHFPNHVRALLPKSCGKLCLNCSQKFRGA